MFTNSTAHVQRKETGIQGMLFSANGSRKFCMCYGNYMFAFQPCMIIVQLCTVDCIVYCCKQHRSLYRPLYSVKTTDIVCRRSRICSYFNTRIA